MNPVIPRASYFTVFLLVCLSSVWSLAQISMPTIPQTTAFLPQSHAVAPAAQPMPLDGVWTINAINKRIRIDRGRAIALDSWLHLLVLPVQANMVVIKDIVKTGPGEYSAYDLPLLGTAKVEATASGMLDVAVQGPLGESNYVLSPVRLDDRNWFDSDRLAAFSSMSQSDTEQGACH